MHICVFACVGGVCVCVGVCTEQRSRGQVTFSIKDKIVNILGFKGHTVSMTTT
jgi:hypothetical protein